MKSAWIESARNRPAMEAMSAPPPILICRSLDLI
jgi:hypothetical protein